MHRFLLIVAVLLCPLLLSGCSSDAPKAPDSGPVAVGQPAPDFTLTDLQGRSTTLSQLRGKVVIVNFWASWCPPCRAEMPSMEQLHRELSGQGLVMLAINIEQDGRRTVPQFLAANPHSFPVLLDDREVVQRRYGVNRFPESFVIRKDGVIDDKIIGAIDWAEPRAVAYFRDLLLR
jgi:thiol-disulfide isomerase/thioredoxin